MIRSLPAPRRSRPPVLAFEVWGVGLIVAFDAADLVETLRTRSFWGDAVPLREFCSRYAEALGAPPLSPDLPEDALPGALLSALLDVGAAVPHRAEVLPFRPRTPRSR